MKTDSDAEIPKSVFKFYSLKDCHVKAFLNHYLYLSHPSQLNDDMDACRDLLYVNDLTQETYEQLVAQICLKAPHFRTSGLSYESDSKDEYRALRESLYNVCFDFSGIISFTDSKKSFFNGTMWAHYTGEKGFAIEFDTKKLIEGMIKNPLNMQFEYPIYRGVEYVDELEALDYDKIHLIDEIGKSIAFQKQKCWESESEWRMYIRSNQYLNTKKTYGRYIHYSAEAIERICLGSKFWDEVSQDKCDIESSVWQYTIKKKYLQFVEELKILRNKVFMSTKCNRRTYKCENGKIVKEIPNPTRSFDPVLFGKMKGNKITIEIDAGYGASEYNEFPKIVEK